MVRMPVGYREFCRNWVPQISDRVHIIGLWYFGVYIRGSPNCGKCHLTLA